MCASLSLEAAVSQCDQHAWPTRYRGATVAQKLLISTGLPAQIHSGWLVVNRYPRVELASSLVTDSVILLVSLR